MFKKQRKANKARHNTSGQGTLTLRAVLLVGIYSTALLRARAIKALTRSFCGLIFKLSIRNDPKKMGQNDPNFIQNTTNASN
ncbi:MAG: hypothetical protein IJR40_04210 [Treponema sp.]|nr:hypothetical protein [Treponema sp.]